MCMPVVSRDRGLAVHVVVGRCLVVPGRGIAVGVPGGYTGWVIPGTQPCQVRHLQGTLTAERAPEAPVGLEWVVRVPSPSDRSRGHPSPYPPLPAVGPGALQAPGRGLG